MLFFVLNSIKRLIAAGVITSALWVTAQAQANATPHSFDVPSVTVTAKRQTTPFQLAHLAQQGFFIEQGIPSHLALLNAYLLREITAEDIVRAGIDAKRLPERRLSEPNYVRSVDMHLQSLWRY